MEDDKVGKGGRRVIVATWLSFSKKNAFHFLLIKMFISATIKSNRYVSSYCKSNLFFVITDNPAANMTRLLIGRMTHSLTVYN